MVSRAVECLNTIVVFVQGRPGPGRAIAFGSVGNKVYKSLKMQISTRLVTGHDFSRAASCPKKWRALAPAKVIFEQAHILAGTTEGRE
jgi:hypothetical protein